VRLAGSLILLAGVLAAADFTGKWSGTAAINPNDPHPLTLVLKQTGNEVVGNTFSEGGNPVPLTGGRADGNVLTIELHGLHQVVQFRLTLSGDRLDGTATSKTQDGQVQAAQVRLTRAQ
jgi:hypothetical protein